MRGEGEKRFDAAKNLVYNKQHMDTFKIGDKVIYPNQGIGIIEDIQEETYDGQHLHVHCIRILANGTLVVVPTANAPELGIRKLIEENTVEKILSSIRSGMVDVAMNWKGRYKEHLDLMRTGTMSDMVVVLKSLYYLSLLKPLSFREKKMMEKAKELMVIEISEVASVPMDTVEKKILENLSACFKDVSSQLDS